jgi:acetylornithine deacetylase/succinyl-diaminopimelate desuccinylase-like protein
MPHQARQRVLRDAIEICSVPAPTFAEERRAALVAGHFHALGAPVSIDDAGNVICALGPQDGEAVVFAAHLDTVFPEDQALTIEGDEHSDRIHGPGIGDNSLGVAALLELARTRVRTPPAQRLILAATVGEEGLGDLRGAKHLLATISCRAFVAVEGAMLDAIETGAVGSTRYRVTFRGPGGHSWGDRGAPSALHGLIEAAARFLAQPVPEGLARNIGRLAGGTSINTIAAEATLELDLRAQHAGMLEHAARSAQDHFGNPPAGLTAEVTVIGQRPSGQITSAHPLLSAARAARTATGLPPAHEGASSTDANAAHGLGIPAITVGITTGAHEHRVQEYINTEPVAAGLAALEHLVDAVTGGRQSR